MKRAVELAAQGIGFTAPNPCVGAVIVKGGYIVAEGFHKKAGEDHAEIVAIKNMMVKSGIITVDLEPSLFQNATLYVTLEPCAHSGKTLPCMKALVSASFKRVVIGMKDPNKLVNGKGIAYLKKHGIEVSLIGSNSLMNTQIRSLNQPFIKYMKTGLPFVTLKAAMTLDGKIATIAGESKWITGEKSRLDAKLERSKCDAIIVGAGTVEADNPELAAAGKFRGKNILRVVIDSKLALDTRFRVFRDGNVLVACSSAANAKSRKRFSEAGISFKTFGKSAVSLKKILKYLAGIEVRNVFVEGGSGVNGHLFDENLSDLNLIDRVLFYYAPKLFGGKNSMSAIGGVGIEKIAKALEIQNSKVEMIDQDLKYDGIINFY